MSILNVFRAKPPTTITGLQKLSLQILNHAKQIGSSEPLYGTITDSTGALSRTRRLIAGLDSMPLQGEQATSIRAAAVATRDALAHARIDTLSDNGFRVRYSVVGRNAAIEAAELLSRQTNALRAV